MAEQAEVDTNHLADSEPQPSTLQNVDLSTPQGTVETTKPALQFKDDQSSATVEQQSPVEGTELKARPRAKSSGTNLKDWGVHQFKITKQLMSERFGKGLRTVDVPLETRIENLKDTQRKYAQLISLVSQFGASFVHVVETQKSLAEHFAFMSVKAPELHTEFHYNSEAQKVIARNGETLLAAAQYFVSNMKTVASKTMEDTLQTVKSYEAARLSYDAYRSELEALRKQANSSQKAAASLPAVAAEFEKHKAKFEQLRHDVDIKLKLLDENKLQVSHKQLVLLHSAFAAYFSGNHTAVDAQLKEFHQKLEDEQRSKEPPSWLEDMPSPRDEHPSQ